MRGCAEAMGSVLSGGTGLRFHGSFGDSSKWNGPRGFSSGKRWRWVSGAIGAEEAGNTCPLAGT